jgi:hypothetical protein
MADPTSPRRVDAIVAFDDLLVDRWHRTPCVLCQRAAPGYYVLWMEIETGFVAMFPLCQSCHRRPDTSIQLAYAMQRRLHPEEEVAPGAWTAWDETAHPSHRGNL